MTEMAGIFGYLVLQLLIGVWISRKIRNEQDYFLAGRSLGAGLATFSIFATWFGAETCIGSAGAIFDGGLSASRADPFGYTLCLLLFGLFFARKLWDRGLTTLADLFRQRFSPGVEKLAVWIMVPSSLIWAAAQIRAFGQIVTSTGVVDAEVALAFAAFIVITYTCFGGLLGDVITDFVQGIFLIGGLAILLVTVVGRVGGPAEALKIIDPGNLTFLAEGESLWAQIDTWMVPVLGSLIAQELVSRSLACRSAAVAHRSSLIASGLYLAVGLIPVTLGLLGPAFHMPLGDPEQFLPTLARVVLPTFLYIVFAGALLSAILSTVDSTLLTVSALVSHNFVVHLMKNPSEAKKVKVARVVVVAAGLFAYVMAMYAEGIYHLVEIASSLGSAGLLVITIFGLHTRFGSAPSAAAALLTGLVVTPLGQYVLEFEAPFVTSILASLGTYVAAELAMRAWGPLKRAPLLDRPRGL